MSVEVEKRQSNSSGEDYKYDPEIGRRQHKVDDELIHAVVGDWDDPNLDVNAIGDLEEDSPYPEVRSAVANTDDPDMPCNTWRAWFVGLIFAIVISGLNQFFFFRYPSVIIAVLVAQLLSFPFGRALAYILPHRTFLGIDLNPGPFTLKEHVLATIMASVGAQSAYATDIIAVQRVFYNQSWNFSYQWFVVMSTQLIGFSLGGIARRFLVAPPSMIWPANLVYCALFNTLHSQHYSGEGKRGGISRERFFAYVLIGGVLWYFVPGYLFTALSYFSWMVWIKPDNVKLGQLTGTVSGLGMSLITFDWTQITYIGSPLAAPWWAEANIIGGFVFFFWILTPILYYSNVWYAQYFPISSRIAFDNTGARYNTSRILTEQKTLDIEAYKAYSPLFLSTTFAISYGLSFASITAIIVHTFLYFRRQIWTQARKSLHEQPDIHARLMSRYKLVPEWWYACIFLSMFAVGVIAIELWPTQMPVWAFVLALVIAFVYMIPIGMIQAITNQQIGLNVITELIIGYMLPGKPVSMMMFKTWGYITMAQGLQFTSDFKLGHYMKIPQRPMFMCQVVATVLAGTTQLGVQAWMFTNIKNMCSPHQPDHFICPSTEVFGTASVIWGLIGPARQFSKGQVYYGLVFFFLVGAITPCIPYFVTRRYPNSFLKYVNFPVIYSGTGLIPPATAVNYVPWGIVGFIFQYYIRRRHFSWWSKYNYVLSAALDSGVAIGAILVFFCLQFPRNGEIGANNVLTWWGNLQAFNNTDGNSATLLAVADGEILGPAPGSW